MQIDSTTDFLISLCRTNGDSWENRSHRAYAEGNNELAEVYHANAMEAYDEMRELQGRPAFDVSDIPDPE